MKCKMAADQVLKRVSRQIIKEDASKRFRSPDPGGDLSRDKSKAPQRSAMGLHTAISAQAKASAQAALQEAQANMRNMRHD